MGKARQAIRASKAKTATPVAAPTLGTGQYAEEEFAARNVLYNTKAGKGTQARRAIAKDTLADIERERSKPGGDLWNASVSSESPTAEARATAGKTILQKTGTKGSKYVDQSRQREWDTDRGIFLTEASAVKLEESKKQAASDQRDWLAENERKAAADRAKATQDHYNKIIGLRKGTADSENRYRQDRTDGPLGGLLSNFANDNSLRNKQRKEIAADGLGIEELNKLKSGDAINEDSKRTKKFDDKRRSLLGRAKRRSNA